MSIKKAIIPAAGMGTRFLPATKAVPKEMLPIVDKPTLQYIIEEAVEAGIEEILIITNRGKTEIEDHFDHSPELENFLLEKGKQALYDKVVGIPDLARLYFLRQKEAKGLGHAVAMAREFSAGEPIAILLGDDIVDAQIPCIGQLIAGYDETQSSILGVQEVPNEDIHKYGVVAPKSDNNPSKLMPLESLVEKPSAEEAPSNYAVMGRYVVTPTIFDILDQTAPGKGGEIQLTDALNTLASKETMYALNFDGKRYDAGDKLGYLKANIEFALKRPELGDDLKAYLKTLV